MDDSWKLTLRVFDWQSMDSNHLDRKKAWLQKKIVHLSYSHFLSLTLTFCLSPSLISQLLTFCLSHSPRPLSPSLSFFFFFYLFLSFPLPLAPSPLNPLPLSPLYLSHPLSLLLSLSLSFTLSFLSLHPSLFISICFSLPRPSLCLSRSLRLSLSLFWQHFSTCLHP